MELINKQDLIKAIEFLSFDDRPTAEWVINEHTYAGAGVSNWRCTHCCKEKYDFITTSKEKPKWDFCPKCGARIGGKSDE